MNQDYNNSSMGNSGVSNNQPLNNNIYNQPQIDNNAYQQPVQNNKPKKNAIGLIIVIVVGVIIAIILTVITISLFVKKSGSEKFYGEWDCNNGIKLLINNKDFNMSIESQAKIDATYKLTTIETEGTYKKYNIDATATRRILDGKEYLEPYTTKYQIVMDDKNNNELSMINVSTYSIYMCERKK